MKKPYKTDTFLHCLFAFYFETSLLRASSHGSQVTSGESVQSQPLRAWKLGLHHCTRGPKFQVPSTTWMPTWPHFFGGEAWDPPLNRVL